MNYVLTSLEYRELLKAELNSKSYDDDYSHVKDWFDLCKVWDVEIIALNHLLSIVGEQLIKEGMDPDVILEYVYQVQEDFNFNLEEGSEWFIETLLKHVNESHLSLEEHLITAKYRML